MNFLNNKWMSFFCACLNVIFAVQCFAAGSWGMFALCSVFGLFCGYNFWKQMEAE